MYDLLLCFGLLLWLAVGFLYVKNPRASLFHPATYYLIVHGIVFVIRPIFAWYLDYSMMYEAYKFNPLPISKIIALAGADLGFVCFMVAVLRFGNAPFLIRKMHVDPIGRGKMLRAYLAVFILCLPISVLATRSIISEKVYDSSTMIRDAATGYAINTVNNGYYTDAALMMLPLLIIFAWIFRFKWWSLLPFVMGVALRAATGSRWPFVMAFFSLCLFFLYEKQKRWVTPQQIVGALVVGLLFTAVGNDRGQSIRVIFGGERPQIQDVQQLGPLESMDYANMEFFEYLVDTIPGKTGTYDYFLDNLQIFTEPIPRVIWNGKPVGAPIQLYSLYDYGYPIGMTYSLPGEGWAQLGWIGIIIWCTFFGWGYGRIYNLFMMSKQTPVQVALYVIFIPLSISAFRDGFLLTVLKTAAFTVLPVLIWGSLLKAMNWRPQRDG